MRRLLPLVAFLLLAPGPARGQEKPHYDSPPPVFQPGRFTLGGYLGFGLGSVNWVSISGEVGYLATERLWIGTTGRFQYTEDHRYEPTTHSVDYGFGAFTRYFVLSQAFAAAEWSWTSYEIPTGSSSTRSSISSLFLGAGYGQGLGSQSILMAEALFDVTGNVKGVYGTPWIFRIGWAMGF